MIPHDRSKTIERSPGSRMMFIIFMILRPMSFYSIKDPSIIFVGGIVSFLAQIQRLIACHLS